MRNPLLRSHMPQPSNPHNRDGNLGVNYLERDYLEHRMEEADLKVKAAVPSGYRYLESPWTMTAAEIPLLPHSADQGWGQEGG